MLARDEIEFTVAFRISDEELEKIGPNPSSSGQIMRHLNQKSQRNAAKVERKITAWERKKKTEFNRDYHRLSASLKGKKVTYSVVLINPLHDKK